MPKRIPTNPIIDQLKAAGGAGSKRLNGFIGRSAAGRIELYSNLERSACIEIDEADIVHVVDGDKPTEPSLLFVRREAQIAVRYDTTVKELEAMGEEECHCEPEAGDVPTTMAMISGGFGATGRTDCQKNKTCKDKCAKKDPFVRQGCMDSCDVSYPCKKIAGLEGGGFVIF